MDRMVGVGNKLQFEARFSFSDRWHMFPTACQQLYSPHFARTKLIVMIGAQELAETIRRVENWRLNLLSCNQRPSAVNDIARDFRCVLETWLRSVYS
jgi:hypothetical protein